MKKLINLTGLLILNLALVVFNCYAQPPQGLSYQAVARDAGGNVMVNQNICVQSTITNGNGGPDLYIESFNTNTNQFGLFNLNIGGGTPVSGLFSSINWAGVTAWQKIEIKIGCTGSYVVMGSSQLLSVPYALEALSSSNTAAVSGTTNYVSKFTGANSIGNSQVFDNGTNVGIGNIAPQAKLDVSTSAPGASAKFNSASGNSLGIYEGNVYKGYVGSYYGGVDDIDLGSITGAVHLVTDGTIDLTADSGNIGIGTTTPLAKLDVVKAGTGVTARFNATDQTYIGLYESGTYRGYLGSFYGNAADIDVGSSTGAVHLVTGNTIDLTADAGDIGIGVTAPAAKLDVSTTTTGQTIRVNAADQVFMGFWENNGYRGYVGSYYGGVADVDLGSLAGSVHLVTGSSIDLTAKAGNIGIGTITPTAKLEVKDTVSSYIRVSSSTGNDYAGIQFERGSGKEWTLAGAGNGDAATGNLVFRVSTDNFATPVTHFELGTDMLRPGDDNTKTLGGSGRRWTEVYAANGTINTSDARDKSNIRNLNYGLAEVMRLRPVSFTWKDHPQRGTKLGLIAQEVKEVVKEVVVHGNAEPEKDENGNVLPETDKYGLYYSDLIPVLIKSIQEQQKIIESQDARIKALESKIVSADAGGTK